MLYERSRSGGQRYLYVGQSKDLTFSDHMHSSFEFILVTKGVLCTALSGEVYTLREGDAILILPNRVHNFVSPEGSENVTVIFSPDYVSEFYAAARGFDFTRPVFRYSDKDALLALDPDKPFACMALLYGICAAAYEACCPEPSRQRDDSLVRKIDDYLYANCQNDIRLETLADELGYNYCYLSDFIGKSFGVGFPALLGSYRIDLALGLLRTTDLSVTEISGRCGFSNTRSFNRTFRKIMGVSPREFIRSADRG